MDIVEELRKAHTEYLQEAWDRWLVTGWKMHGVYTKYSAINFMKQYNLTLEDFCKLKRTPKYPMQKRTMLTRFVAAYLPVLSSMLWNDDPEEKIMSVMKGIDTLKEAADIRKIRAESKERTAAKKAMMAEQKSHHLVKQQREYTSKSNWRHCK